MKLIPFDCFNETGAKLTFYINPEKVVSVSGGTLPGDLIGPDEKALPIEAAIIILQNGQALTVKDIVENVVNRLEKGK